VTALLASQDALLVEWRTMTKKKKEKETELPNFDTEVLYDFRFMKLNNGDEILCQVPKADTADIILVRFPMKISTMFNSELDEAVYVFTPWVPFSSQELIAINKIAIVTMTTIRPEIKEIYLKKTEVFQRQSFRQVTIPTGEVDSSKAKDVEDTDEEESVAEAPKKPWVH
jgi:hypothetical protein